MPASQARSASASPSTGKPKKSGNQAQGRDGRGRFLPAPSLASPLTPKRVAELAAAAGEAEDDQSASTEERLKSLEKLLRRVQQENVELKEEVWRLNDKMEEEVWARKQIEERLKRYEEAEEREAEKERERSEERKGEKESLKADLKEMIKEVVLEEIGKGDKQTEESRSGERVGVSRHEEEQNYRCIILTDSNGRDATQESIRSHMPSEVKAKYDIEIVVAYRLEDAFHRIKRGEIKVRDAYVVIDNLTNNIRGNWRMQGESPEQVVDGVARLRDLILSLSAAAVVVCEVKPMGMIDVRPFNSRLHHFLSTCGTNGYGCNTQIRMEFLAPDGFHVNKKFATVLDRTYACALRGTPVPCPLVDDDFVPPFYRRSWDSQWPRLEGRLRRGLPGS